MEWLTLLLGGGLLVGLAAVLTVFARRRTDKDTDAQARFAANIELNKYIDTKIAEATAPLKLKIESMETDLNGFRDRDNAVKNVLRSFFQRLQWWDEIGRPGKMPMPSAEDMATLDLDLDLSPSLKE